MKTKEHKGETLVLLSGIFAETCEYHNFMYYLNRLTASIFRIMQFRDTYNLNLVMTSRHDKETNQIYFSIYYRPDDLKVYGSTGKDNWNLHIQAGFYDYNYIEVFQKFTKAIDLYFDRLREIYGQKHCLEIEEFLKMFEQEDMEFYEFFGTIDNNEKYGGDEELF